MNDEAKSYLKEEYPLNRKTSQTMALHLRNKHGVKVNYGDLSLIVMLLGLKQRSQKEAMAANYRDKKIWR